MSRLRSERSGQAKGAAHGDDVAVLRTLWATMSPAARRLAGYAAIAGLAAAVAELVLLSMLHTFLSSLMGPAQPGSPHVILLAGVVVITALSRIWVVRQQDAWALGVAGELSVGLFRTALEQPHCGSRRPHTAELFSGLEKTQALVNGALVPLASGLLNFTIALCIACYLAVLAPSLVAVAALAVATAYALVHALTRKRLRSAGERVAVMSGRRMRAAHEMQHGVREIVLAAAEARVIDDFRRIEDALRAAQQQTRLLVQAPRYLIEAAILLCVFVIVVAWGDAPGGIASMIPLAGALAVGGQRLIPLIHQAYLAWGTFRGSLGLLRSVLGQVAPSTRVLPANPSARMEFKIAIGLSGVVFGHPGREAALKGLELTIPRGARIGIRGATGVGKSTLLDVIAGLATPQEGDVVVDGVAIDNAERRRSWISCVAFVPQHIYLRDAPLRDVIAFPDNGDEIDDSRVAAAVERARLSELVASLPGGLGSTLGDFGSRLSGGQRQRVAIARALYRNASVLLLDEATGQLDEATEGEVLDGLDSLGRELTVVVVAHRPSALVNCDVVYELRDGVLWADTASASAAVS